MKGNCTRLERYNGTGWDTISNRINISGPALTRETVEEELVIDCDPAGGASTKRKSPGTKELGDISMETIWNPLDHVGVLQIETATCAGTVTVAGNASVTIAGAGLPGSPLALNIPVTTGLPAVWAAQIRTFLASNAAVAGTYRVSGEGAAIVLTRRPVAGVAPADDATLNIAIATGSATGITAAITSADTRAGVAGIVNEENHHLFMADFDSGTATFWRVVHPDAAISGIIVHGTVKEVGAADYAANETVKRTVMIEPTGEFYLHANAITSAPLPTAIVAPSANWGR